jgi:hypothetical protein
MLSIPESTCRSVIKTYNERKSFEKARRSGRLRKMSGQSKAKNKLESALKNRFKKQWKCAVSGRPPFSANTFGMRL